MFFALQWNTCDPSTIRATDLNNVNEMNDIIPFSYDFSRVVRRRMTSGRFWQDSKIVRTFLFEKKKKYIS